MLTYADVYIPVSASEETRHCMTQRSCKPQETRNVSSKVKRTEETEPVWPPEGEKREEKGGGANRGEKMGGGMKKRKRREKCRHRLTTFVLVKQVN
jgi:hypothetical protein